MRLNLVIDKKNQKALYAEVEKPFVDFLFHLLTIPAGALIMQLTKKGIMGCLGDLYESVESLSETCMQLNQSKNPLLGPSYKNWSPSLPTQTKYFLCPNPNTCFGVAHSPSTVFPKCCKAIALSANWIPSGNEKLAMLN